MIIKKKSIIVSTCGEGAGYRKSLHNEVDGSLLEAYRNYVANIPVEVGGD